MKKVVMYINQFFGQIGGEEKADIGPQLREGPVGPAVALNGLLQDAQITYTIICGDNYMGEKIEQAAQNISDRRCGSCGEAGKSNALKQVFADMDLMTDGAVCAGTVMAGFRCDIGNRGQHNKCQHYGQQARHKTKFLCHGLPSFAIL